MDVLYGPGKRVAFRMRWYLIVFLVTLPLLMITYNITKSLVLLESAGKLVIPSSEIFAQVAGRVEQIEAKPGDTRAADEPILFLSNPSLTTRFAELTRLKALNEIQSSTTLFSQLDELLQRQVAEAARWERKVKQLGSSGIVTQHEMKEASEQLANANRALLETRLRKQEWLANQRQRERDGVSQEEIYLAEREVKSLTVTSRESVRVLDIYVSKGQWVDQGEPLARVRHANAIQIWLYVDLPFADHARTGEKFTVILPNGDRYPAQIIKGADRALKVPNELREAFSGNQPGLLALAEFRADIDPSWEIEQLPVRARFTPHWLQSIERMIFP